ncbi:MAG: methyltransferase domain-containing protein [Candidatus Omnitrophica bacterium]|nr:methyltransferase domain-containing protein [Candidatus Omnitrophota bacterium]
MSDKFVLRKNCRMCNSTNLEMALPLAPLPIGDRYVPEAQKMEVTETFPMDVMICKDCGHLQNSGYVKPEFIYKHYLSRPATTNPVLSQAYKDYADYLLANFKESNDPFAVETGSNDGAFSKYFCDNGLRSLGVEPSPNLAKQANERGIPTLQAYFSEDLAKKIKKDHGPANFFVANHMFANVEDSTDFIKGVKHLLSPKGVHTMQTFYMMDVLEKNMVENFTHEHLSYFNIRPYRDFLARNGMKLFDVQRIAAKGGSIRCFSEHADGPYPVKPSVQECIDLEDRLNARQAKAYDSILKFIKTTKEQFHKLLEPVKAKGGLIAGFGTSIGATTFVHQYELGKLLNFFVDDDQYRHNLVSPVHHIPVLPTNTIYDRKPEYVVILAPLYADNIMKKNKAYLDQGGKFLLFWPEFKIVKELK